MKIWGTQNSCQGFSSGASGKEPACLPANARDIREMFNPWVGKMPWRKA